MASLRTMPSRRRRNGRVMLGDAASPQIGFIPARAREEWLRLNRLLDRIGPTPCQSGDPEAWWASKPVDRALKAIEACYRCQAQDACLTYALAADERFGIWGGMLPEERRSCRWRQARASPSRSAR